MGTLSFGIDPGSRVTGWGVVRMEGSRASFVDAGVVKVDAKAPLAARLQGVFQGLQSKLQDAQPDLVCLESVFHHKSAKSALVLGQARGVALLCGALSGCPVFEVSPAEVKKMVTGSGRADKQQVAQMLKISLGLTAALPADATDALAIAVAGASLQRWAGVQARQLGGAA